MGEFREIAEELLNILKRITAGELGEVTKEGILSKDIPEILGRVLRGRYGEVNCYPGIPNNICHDVAFFVSLSSRYGKGRRGHLSCKEAIEKLVQHMQGLCPGKTRYAIVITDSWDGEAFSNWEIFLRQIQRNAHLEIYLLTGSVSEIII